MTIPVNLYACGIAPDSEECKKSKKFLGKYLKSVYLLRYLPQPSTEPPSFEQPPHSVDPFYKVATAELFLNALQGDNPNTPMLQAFKETNLQYEVVNELIGELETAVEGLKQELKELD